jgi:uncharacterized membrane protein YgdD (TMEM256/DUF423 family)
MRLWLFLAALNGFVAVLAGAYGYHWLEVSEQGFRDVFKMGVDYHMWHALALLAVAWLAERSDTGPAVVIAGWGFLTGILLFCGSLYALGLTGETVLPGAAPLGGFAFLLGWAALAWTALRGR